RGHDLRRRPRVPLEPQARGPRPRRLHPTVHHPALRPLGGGDRRLRARADRRRRPGAGGPALSRIYEQNRRAWNREVEAGNEWTQPVSSEVIERARRGDWSVLLTPTQAVPREWLGDLHGKAV